MASREFLAAIDLSKNELRNAAVQNLSTAPSSPATGQIYFDTVLGYLRVYDSAAWINVLSTEGLQDLVGAMVTGNTETGVTVSYDDSSGVLNFVLLALDQLPAPTGDLSMASHKITNLTDGSSSQDAVTFSQLQAYAMGVRDAKQSCRVATTVAGTLASSFENADTVDGVTLATGDRILIKNQVAGAENGIYTVNASGAPTRATDADASSEVTAGMYTFITEGTTNADTGWLLTTNDVIVLGTTALTFVQFTGASMVAGTAINISGSTINVLVDGTTIDASGSGGSLQVVAAYRKLKFASDFGDGSSQSFNVDHNLGTKDCTVKLYNNSTGAEVEASVAHTTTNRVVVATDTVPTTNQYRVVVIA